MNFIKRLTNRILLKLAIHLNHLLDGRVIKYVKNPDLISKNAFLYNSRLNGDIQIGDNCKISDVVLNGNIRIGSNSSLFGPNLDIIAKIHPVAIGKFCSIARNTSIQEYNHPADRLTTYFINKNVFEEEGIERDVESKGPIVIGNDVWIGAHCLILSGAKIGNGAIIAANSVVTNEIPSFAIAAGSPARVLKFRFQPDIIEKIESVRWWDWPMDKIKRNKNLFTGKLTIEKLNRIID